MKRSKVVALVAIGIGPLALAACDRRPDCQNADQQTQDCRQAASGHGGDGGSRHWWIGGSTSDAGAVASTGDATATRGGFGATGEAVSGSGHGGEGGGGHGSGGGHGGGGGE